MSNWVKEPASFVGLRLCEKDIKSLLGEQSARIILARDRFPSHITLFPPVTLSEADAKEGLDTVKEALYQIWEGVGGEIIRAIDFATYGPMGELDGNSHLTVTLDEQMLTQRIERSYGNLGIRDIRNPLPLHTTVCKDWNKTDEGLVVPDNFEIGIEAMSIFTKNPNGERDYQDIF